MRVIFKNVNQGDSIIIEWEQEGKTKIGLIDCHIENGNPSLRFIRENGNTEIEFIIISHPHYDHYSGILDLFKYCQNNGIKVNRLGFTFDVSVSFAYSGLASVKAQELLDFFNFLAGQRRKRKVENRTILTSFPVNDSTQSLDFSEFKIDFLRPSHSDILSLGRGIGKFISKENESLPDLNIFSSVLELRKGMKSILLTSDAPRKSFKPLKNYYRNREREFHLVQIPHHGSIHNHHLSFWQSLKKISGCPAVFSVGDEANHKLPNLQVVEEVSNEGFEVYSTNIVYGIAEYLGKSTKPRIPTIMQRARRKITPPLKSSLSSKFQGDKLFVI